MHFFIVSPFEEVLCRCGEVVADVPHLQMIFFILFKMSRAFELKVRGFEPHRRKVAILPKVSVFFMKKCTHRHPRRLERESP